MLEKVEGIRQTRSEQLDRWIAANVFTPYGELVDDVLRNSDQLQEALKELGGDISLIELRRHASYQGFIDNLSNKLLDLTGNIGDKLVSTSEIFHNRGVKDTSIIGSWQISVGNYTNTEIAKAIQDGVTGFTGGYLPSGIDTRIMGTSASILSALAEKIASRIVLSRTRLPNLSPIIQNTMGQGLMWLGNQTNIALWGSYQNGIWRVMNSYPWMNRWMWVAQLDHRTCISCVALHGTIHEPNEELYDHPNGRCMALPLAGGPPVSLEVGGVTVPGSVILTPSTVRGADWFNSQPKSTQIGIMGPKAYDAWKGGKVRIEDLSVAHDHPLYGQIMRRGSVKEVLGE